MKIVKTDAQCPALRYVGDQPEVPGVRNAWPLLQMHGLGNLRQDTAEGGRPIVLFTWILAKPVPGPTRTFIKADQVLVADEIGADLTIRVF
jgi:hypothetical protein